MRPITIAITSTEAAAGAAFAELRRNVLDVEGPEIAPIWVGTYSDLFEAVHLQTVDAGWCPPLVARDLLRVAAADPIAAVLRDGVAEYYSAIVVGAASPVRQLVNLETARVGWVSRSSAAGYLVAREYLRSLGVSLVFREESFLQSHVRVLEALERGEVDLAATYAVLLDHGVFHIRRAPEGTRVLGAAGPIPGEVIVASRALVAEHAAALAEALFRVQVLRGGALSRLLDVSGFAALAARHMEQLDRWFQRAVFAPLRPFAPRAVW